MNAFPMRLAAITLALLTIAAAIFGVLNFQQRARYITPDDGISWQDGSSGVSAWLVATDSPGARSGIRPGDALIALNGAPVRRAAQVTQRLWRLGVWSEARYSLSRDGRKFETTLITVPADQSSSIENYLRIVGLLYLFIGLFIFLRRWTATRAVHFYLFCLASFVLYAFHYTGKLNSFDSTIYWSNIVAMLLQPALLVHFAMVFPERRKPVAAALACLYLPAALLLALHVGVATQALGFVPTLSNRILLDRLELAYLGGCFCVAAMLFLRSYRRAPSGVLRQQLKWVTGGTLAATLPFLVFYILPFFLGVVPQSWMKLSVISLALLPLCFGYAIIRYRLMDVDIIFKRGLAYTAATMGVVAVYFLLVALIGELFHSAMPDSRIISVLAVVVTALLFQPLRDLVQERLDHFFYRDRLDYRRTLIEFGRTLTKEIRLEPMAVSALDRISQTFLVDRLALFLEDPRSPGHFQLGRLMGARVESALDLSFLDAGAFGPGRNFLFFESSRSARMKSDSVRASLEQLDLNYFLPCRVREEVVAVLGVGKTVDGDFLSSEDVELLQSIAGYVGIAVENSRLYESLAEKAAQVERLKDFSENIVGSLNVGVMALDLQGRIESWNPQLERLMGVGRERAMGQPMDTVLPPELVAEIAARTSEDRPSIIYKFPLENRAGKSMTVNVSVTPLVDKGGSSVGRLLLLDDVTQREQLEEQLLQTEKLTSLGLLAAGVAHEVNTPLAVISNYIQMLAKQLPGDDSRQKIIDKIVKQTFRASEIVNNLLNFSRTGAAEFAEVNLNELIEETLSLVAHPFRTSRVTVLKTMGNELPLVLGSANRLQQVFLNLLMNARDAMPNGGMVEIRTAAQNGSVEVEVTDTGMGIPREILNRIFDPFFTTKSIGRGTGLGLSVSYGIVKEHNGIIDVRSTPGKGTSFRLEFPAVKKPIHV
jgi:two-component system NtrC family sensor kinase